jgi:glutamate carboxypeptidase
MAQAEQSAFLETLSTLVGIDSGTGDTDGLARVAEILVARLEALGGEVELVPAAGAVVGDNIVARFRGRGTSRILLMIHYDTVFPTGEAGQRPFRVDDDRLYGPGVADARGSIALILHALGILKALHYDGFGEVMVLFNPDEEKGSFGSRDLIRSLAAEQDYVLSFEPPDTDAVTIATNGINYLFLRVSGIASHAGSAPEQGRNAVIELAHQLLQLNDLGDQDKGTTVNWTVVRGGERRNVIPASATAEGDMRYSDYGELERVTADANRIIDKRLVADTSVVFELQRGRPPLPPNPASKRLAKIAAEVYSFTGRTLATKKMRFGTDAGYAYRPDTASPAVLETLGLVGGGLHSEAEYVELDSVVPRLYLAAQMIITLSGRH